MRRRKGPRKGRVTEREKERERDVKKTSLQMIHKGPKWLKDYQYGNYHRRPREI